MAFLALEKECAEKGAPGKITEKDPVVVTLAREGKSDYDDHIKRRGVLRRLVVHVWGKAPSWGREGRGVGRSADPRETRKSCLWGASKRQRRAAPPCEPSAKKNAEIFPGARVVGGNFGLKARMDHAEGATS